MQSTHLWVNFYGLAEGEDGSPLAVGSVVQAIDPQGVLCGVSVVTTPGQYGLLACYGDDPDTAVDEGAQPGDTIRFVVDDAVLANGRWGGNRLRAWQPLGNPPFGPLFLPLIGQQTSAPTLPFGPVYLPLVGLGSGANPSGADLVVTSILVDSGTVEVVIRNQGGLAVTDEFWVDLYIDPSRPPVAVNEVWNSLGTQGAVWGVTTAGLPLSPGQALTLTLGLDDPFFAPEYSALPPSLSPGSQLYAQVDSWGSGTTHGAVLESHEVGGGPYNNITGPVVVSTGVELGNRGLSTPGAASPKVRP